MRLLAREGWGGETEAGLTCSPGLSQAATAFLAAGGAPRCPQTRICSTVGGNPSSPGGGQALGHPLTTPGHPTADAVTSRVTAWGQGPFPLPSLLTCSSHTLVVSVSSTSFCNDSGGHGDATALPRTPPNPNQPFWGAASLLLPAGAHQRDEVGEGEGQVDVHHLVGGDDGAQILVVTPLLEEVVDEPLLLVNAEPAWGARGQAEPQGDGGCWAPPQKKRDAQRGQGRARMEGTGAGQDAACRCHVGAQGVQGWHPRGDTGTQGHTDTCMQVSVCTHTQGHGHRDTVHTDRQTHAR